MEYHAFRGMCLERISKGKKICEGAGGSGKKQRKREDDVNLQEARKEAD